MLANKLKINESKTELILFAPKQSRHAFGDISITFGGSFITPTSSVRDLGAYFDSDLSMTSHVNNVLKTGYYHLRRIAKIRCHLDRSSCAKAVIAFVISRLDYHNGLLAGITQRNLHRLQCLQNNAARLVTKSPRGCHITPILADLHWLPVHLRIDYKVLTNTQRAIQSPTSPSYLQQLCVAYRPSRQLRSSSANLLSVPKTQRRAADSAFSVYACRLWNSLPSNLRAIQNSDSFKTSLKTHFFNLYFTTN